MINRGKMAMDKENSGQSDGKEDNRIRRKKTGFKDWWDRDCTKRKRLELYCMKERKDKKRERF